MKSIFFVTFIFIFIQSCFEKSEQVDTINEDYNLKLKNTFAEVIEIYPKDSVSLYRIYFIYRSTSSSYEIQKQIEQLESLISNNTKRIYFNVENKLKPLMTGIVNSNTFNVSQLDSIVLLYSDFDYYLGMGLFSQLIGEKENYQLVWKTFEVIANNRTNHSSSLSALIKLDKNINTNVELAEAMPEFVVESIYNNPTSLLDIYLENEIDIDYLDYLSDYFRPHYNLISILKDISDNSANEKHRKTALDLIEQLNEK